MLSNTNITLLIIIETDYTFAAIVLCHGVHRRLSCDKTRQN